MKHFLRQANKKTSSRRTPDRKARVRTSAPAAEGRRQDSYEIRVSSLHYVMEETLNWMAPGDILLLEKTASLREFVDPLFYAMLACPSCGKLDLITQRQYSGTEAVICAHKDCCCHFRIDQKQHLRYLPVN